MSVPELFHHQRRFLGSLTVRPVTHALAGATATDLALSTQAIDHGESMRCPALSPDGRCSIHEDRKPATCRVVPFDAWLPDSMQHLVLASRAAEAHYLGSDCLAAGTRAGLPVVTQGLRVVNADVRAALAERRRDLADEWRFWGSALCAELRATLLDRPSRFSGLPPGGFMTLSITPVLMVLAKASRACRERCIAYLDAQASLFGRPHETSQLAVLARSNAQLQSALAADRLPFSSMPAGESAALERWLGLTHQRETEPI